MKYRIAIWAAAGFLVASGWAVYFFMKDKDLPIAPLVSTLVRANLPHCNCRLALPREHLFGPCRKHRHICTVRSSGGNLATAIKPLKLIQDCSLRSRYWAELVRSYRDSSNEKQQQQAPNQNCSLFCVSQQENILSSVALLTSLSFRPSTS